MKRVRNQVAIFVAVIFTLALFVPLQAESAFIGEREISSKSAIVMDFNTGVVLYSHNADEQRVPASTTKLMAAYVIYDSVRAGEITLNTRTKISKSTSSFSYNTEYSNVPLPEGSAYTINQLLEVVLIRSACAATVAMGEALCGSETAFVARMNLKASKLGLGARFYDSYGGSKDNRISAWGMAELAKVLIRDFPEILKITSKGSVTFNGQKYNSSNLLLGVYSGLDGLKTGYTVPAGYCFIGTAERNGHRLIAVTMGSTLESRYPDTRVLLDYGFAIVDKTSAEQSGADNTKPPDGSSAAPPGEVSTTTPDGASAVPPDGSSAASPGEASAAPPDGASAVPPDGALAVPPGEIPAAEQPEAIPSSDQSSANLTAVPSNAGLMVNGVNTPLTAYVIGELHYFKLRDIAYLLNGTEKQFEVTWSHESKTASIVSGVQYTVIGDELVAIRNTARPYMPTTSNILFNGEEHGFEIYLIDNANYFKLRDLGQFLEFDINWVVETHTVVIDTPAIKDEAPAVEIGTQIVNVDKQPDMEDHGDLVGLFLSVIADLLGNDLSMDSSIEMLSFDLFELDSLSEGDKGKLLSEVHRVYSVETLSAAIDELYERGLLAKESIYFSNGLQFTFTNVRVISANVLVFAVSKWRGTRNVNVLENFIAIRSDNGVWSYASGDW